MDVKKKYVLHLTSMIWQGKQLGRTEKFACWKCDSLKDAENIKAYRVALLKIYFAVGSCFSLNNFVVLFHTAGNLT